MNRHNNRPDYQSEAVQAISATAKLLSQLNPLIPEDYIERKLLGRVALNARFNDLLITAAELAPTLMTDEIRKKRTSAELCRLSVLQTLEKKKQINIMTIPMSKEQQQEVKSQLKSSLKIEKSEASLGASHDLKTSVSKPTKIKEKI